MTTTRDEFEARSQHSKRLLWKRGGSVFAEGIPEGDYVDAGIQHDWLLWQEAWQASRRAALEEAAKVCDAQLTRYLTSGISMTDSIRASAEAIRALVLAQEG